MLLCYMLAADTAGSCVQSAVMVLPSTVSCCCPRHECRQSSCCHLFTQHSTLQHHPACCPLVLQVGPARPILGRSDDNVQQLCEHFSKLLEAFDRHPWTLQRLCELLLEPQRQYKRLHKLVSRDLQLSAGCSTSCTLVA